MPQKYANDEFFKHVNKAEHLDRHLHPQSCTNGQILLVLYGFIRAASHRDVKVSDDVLEVFLQTEAQGKTLLQPPINNRADCIYCSLLLHDSGVVKAFFSFPFFFFQSETNLRGRGS